MTTPRSVIVTRLVAGVPLVVAVASMWWWSAEVDRELQAIAAAERDQREIAGRIERVLGPDVDLLERKRAVEAVELVVRAVSDDAAKGNAAARLRLVEQLGVTP